MCMIVLVHEASLERFLIRRAGEKAAGSKASRLRTLFKTGANPPSSPKGAAKIIGPHIGSSFVFICGTRLCLTKSSHKPRLASGTYEQQLPSSETKTRSEEALHAGVQVLPVPSACA